MLDDTNIGYYLQRHFYQLKQYNKKIKNHFKCKEFDLIETSQYTDKHFIEDYNKEFNYILENLVSKKWCKIVLIKLRIKYCLIILTPLLLILITKMIIYFVNQ